MNKVGIIAVVVLAICVATATFFLLSNDIKLPPFNLTEPVAPKYDYTGGSTIYPGEYRESFYNEITDDYRPIYDIEDIEYEWIFGELPKMPSDFFNIANLIYDGKITDYTRLSEAYWKQPEFYPAWFKVFQSTYPDNPLEYWAPEAFGCYPGMKQVTIDKGTTAIVDTYFRTGFGVESYQGIVVRAKLPDKAVNILGNEMFQQPAGAEDYINVRIINEDDTIFSGFKDTLRDNNVGEDDWFIVLNPTYTLLKDKTGVIVGYKGFSSDWVKVLQLEIIVSGNTPVGDYIVSVDADTPSFGINQEYYYSNTHPYYGNLYFPVATTLKQTTPMFQVILSVV